MKKYLSTPNLQLPIPKRRCFETFGSCPPPLVGSLAGRRALARPRRSARRSCARRRGSWELEGNWIAHQPSWGGYEQEPAVVDQDWGKIFASLVRSRVADHRRLPRIGATGRASDRRARPRQIRVNPRFVVLSHRSPGRGSPDARTLSVRVVDRRRPANRIRWELEDIWLAGPCESLFTLVLLIRFRLSHLTPRQGERWGKNTRRGFRSGR